MWCSYAIFGCITYTVRKKACDKHGQVLVIEAWIGDTGFLLFKLYNANIKSGEITTFAELTNLLENTKNKLMIFAGYFNLFFGRSLDAKVGNPCLKKQSLGKLRHIKEKYNLCDI